MVLFCDTPEQSVVAAVLAGVLGGVAGVTLGLDPVGVAVFAGALGGLGDLSAHLVRRDEQFLAALDQVRGGRGQ